MNAPHAVVSGASIAGLSTAFWLSRTGWQVTVLERAEAFRDGGQNVDVRGVAHEVLDRMGLVDAIAAQHTTETGTVFVDADGEVTAELPSDGPDGATAELEVLRGDFARVIADALPTDIGFRYGTIVAAVDDRGDTVHVTTDAGDTLAADLLVVAEGVRSSTRDLLFAGVADARPLGIAMMFGTIPRTPEDDTRWRWYTAVGGRQVHLRPDRHGTTRAILAWTHDDDADVAGLDLPDALTLVRERFAGAGWQAPRVLDGFDSSGDVYLDDLTQMRLATYHRGRVCVLGDAAWCVTPLGGGGASLALTAGYVLAAELSAADPRDDAAVAGALDAFEAWMRPLVDRVQKLPPGLSALAYPQTRLGLALRGVAMRVMTSGPVATATERLMARADTDRPLPEITGR